MSTGGYRLSSLSAPHSGQAEAIDALERACTVSDGIGPFDDEVRLDIQFGERDGVTHLIAVTDDGMLAGYYHLHTDADDATGHLAVDPAHRRHGIGTSLVDQARERTRSLRLWAHGNLPAAQTFARRLGLTAVRELRQLRARAVATGPLTRPDGVTVRHFEVGRDEAAWLELNARAFAGHPEQGRMTLDDLRHRITQDWFDPEGFFLAERSGRLIGFHWTKVDDGAKASGEVYVLGVDPSAQGLGLGKFLTRIGLRYLTEVRGVDEVRLYVEASNAAAVALYEGLGFSTSRVDVVYANSPGRPNS